MTPDQESEPEMTLPYTKNPNLPAAAIRTQSWGSEDSQTKLKCHCQQITPA